MKLSHTEISVILALTLICSTSGAPFIVRLRRSLEEQATQKDDSSNTKSISESLEPTDIDDISKGSSNLFTKLSGEKDGKLKKKSRQNKALAFFDFIPQFYTGEDDYDDEIQFEQYQENEDDDLSRTIPSRRKQNPYKNIGNSNALPYDNSPIYYIRLPPTPYMFVPGLGYISQPPSLGPPVPPPVNPFINLPIEFVSNGKPTNVYQWSGAPTFQQPAPIDPYNQLYNRPQLARPQKPSNFGYQKPITNKKPTDSKVTNLKQGPYLFNGKPNDSVFVLRDSYNSLYSDALQNFYP